MVMDEDVKVAILISILIILFTISSILETAL